MRLTAPRSWDPLGTGTLLGTATYGLARADLGSNSGWNYDWNTTGVSAGSHTIYAVAHSTVTGSSRTIATRTLTLQ